MLLSSNVLKGLVGALLLASLSYHGIVTRNAAALPYGCSWAASAARPLVAIPTRPHTFSSLHCLQSAVQQALPHGYHLVGDVKLRISTAARRPGSDAAGNGQASTPTSLSLTPATHPKEAVHPSCAQKTLRRLQAVAHSLLQMLSASLQ